MILSKGSKNRRKWKHGFSQCAICQAKLMAYLEKGHSLADVINLFEQRWKEKPRRTTVKPIKNIRRFAMNAIRQTTGYGFFDNYIVLHADRLWTPRNPILAQDEMAEDLKEKWKINAAKGRYLIAVEKAEYQLEKEIG